MDFLLTNLGTFTQQTTEYLQLSNNSNTPLAFKVKTTAPKLYCVRPNAGLIHPNESAEISIILQGFAQPLPQDYKCKDKFLIVSLPAPDIRDASRVSDQWSQLEQKFGDQLVSRKLKVNYFITDDDKSYDDNYEDEIKGSDINDHTRSAGAGAGAVKSHNNRSNGDYNGNHSSQNGGVSRGQRDTNDSYNEKQHQTRSEPVPQNAQSYTAPPPVQNHQASDYQPQKVIATEPIQGISIQLAALLIVLAFLAGWLLF